MRIATRVLVATMISVLAVGVAPAGSASAKVSPTAVACCGGR
jgi:hypothetical protein